MVAPGRPERSIQPVDVGDLAAFTLDCIEQDRGGAFNVAAPIGWETFGGMLDACREVAGSDAEPWTPARPRWSGRRAGRWLEGVGDTWAWMVETGVVMPNCTTYCPAERRTLLL
jgi:nucleoside-diphosphate-sugar epimerase